MDVVFFIDKIEKFYLLFGYPLIFLGSFIETTPLGWAIPGGVIVALGGFYAYSNGISLILVIIAAWLGMLGAFLAAYFLGQKTGLRLVKRLNQEKNAKRAKILLENHGGTILTTSLMANLTRFWVSYLAGTQKYSFPRFLFYSSTASLTWTSLLAVVGFLAGSGRQQIETGLTRLGILSWVILLLTILLVYLKTKSEFEKFKEDEV